MDLEYTLAQSKLKVKDWLHKKVDGLHKNVDGLHKKVEGLHKKVDGLHKKVDCLHKKVDGLHKADVLHKPSTQKTARMKNRRSTQKSTQTNTLVCTKNGWSTFLPAFHPKRSLKSTSARPFTPKRPLSFPSAPLPPQAPTEVPRRRPFTPSAS